MCACVCVGGGVVWSTCTGHEIMLDQQKQRKAYGQEKKKTTAAAAERQKMLGPAHAGPSLRNATTQRKGIFHKQKSAYLSFRPLWFFKQRPKLSKKQDFCQNLLSNFVHCSVMRDCDYSIFSQISTSAPDTHTRRHNKEALLLTSPHCHQLLRYQRACATISLTCYECAVTFGPWLQHKSHSHMNLSSLSLLGGGNLHAFSVWTVTYFVSWDWKNKPAHICNAIDEGQRQRNTPTPQKPFRICSLDTVFSQNNIHGCLSKLLRSILLLLHRIRLSKVWYLFQFFHKFIQRSIFNKIIKNKKKLWEWTEQQKDSWKEFTESAWPPAVGNE